MAKLASMERIAQRIKPGDLLAFGYVHSGFDILFQSLCQRGKCTGVDVMIPCVLRYRPDWLFHLDRIVPGFDGRFLIAQIAPEHSRLPDGKSLDILPLCLSQIPSYLNDSASKRRVWVFSEISPPDEKGFCNTGYSAPFPVSLYPDCTSVGLVNEKVPPTLGDTSLPVEVFDYLVEMPAGVPLYPEPEITESMVRVGKNVSGLIEEGATIECGVGEILYAVLRALSGRKNLRFQSGILPQEIASLVDEGCFKDKVSCNVTSARSPDFYDWLKMNPAVQVKAMDYTHNILLLSQQNRFTAIGSAICIDLLGQVVSETLGYRQITGVGGSLDFARASGMGNGKSIIALTSTYGREEHPKIVPFLKRGDVVNITRYDVDYVVTEFGVAELKYRSRQERTLNLISVAHPQHREELMAAARETRLI